MLQGYSSPSARIWKAVLPSSSSCDLRAGYNVGSTHGDGPLAASDEGNAQPLLPRYLDVRYAISILFTILCQNTFNVHFSRLFSFAIWDVLLNDHASWIRMTFTAARYEMLTNTVPKDSLDILVQINSYSWAPETEIDSAVVLSSATTSALPPSSCMLLFNVDLIFNGI